MLLPDLLPAVVLGPLIGALVDRWGWRACAMLGDAIRCLAFLLLLFGGSLELMIGGAALAGPAPPCSARRAGRAAAARPGRPAAGRDGLFGALDDLGLTLGPALAALLLFVLPTDGLLALNAVSFAVSGLLIAGIRVSASRRRG